MLLFVVRRFYVGFYVFMDLYRVLYVSRLVYVRLALSSLGELYVPLFIARGRVGIVQIVLRGRHQTTLY